MNTYEITFIAKEDLKEPVVKKTVEALGGRILSEVKLGQKNFVYPIKKEKSGFYTSLVLEIDPQKIQDLNKKLLLEEEILRFLIVTINVNKPMTEVPEVELKPEEISGKPEDTTAIIAPETEIIEAPKTEIVAELVESEKQEESESKTIVEEKPKKPAKKEAIPAVKEVKEEKKPEKLVAKEKPTKQEKESIDDTEEERLEALDKKLEELLKE